MTQLSRNFDTNMQKYGHHKVSMSKNGFQKNLYSESHRNT